MSRFSPSADLTIDLGQRFRWVELQIDVILSKANPILHPKDIQTFEELRHDSGHPLLDSVYRDLFTLNTQGQIYRHTLVVKAMQWVLCSPTPLTMNGLVQAVAFDQYGDIDPVIERRFLLEIGNIFILVTKSGTVKFAHRSAREFRVQSLLRNSQREAITLRSAHAQASESCLAFLISLKDDSKWGNLRTDGREDAEFQ